MPNWDLLLSRRIVRIAVAGVMAGGLAGGVGASAYAQGEGGEAAAEQGPTPVAPSADEAGVTAAAVRCMAHAGVGGDGTTYADYTGSAVDCYPTWTYSFRLRFKQGSTTRAEKLLQGKSGSTYYTLPTHRYFFGTNGAYGCAELRVYHSATVGQNLVDVATSCLWEWSRPAE
jgi:hypothetical protein